MPSTDQKVSSHVHSLHQLFQWYSLKLFPTKCSLSFSFLSTSQEPWNKITNNFSNYFITFKRVKLYDKTQKQVPVESFLTTNDVKPMCSYRLWDINITWIRRKKIMHMNCNQRRNGLETSDYSQDTGICQYSCLVSQEITGALHNI